MLEHIISYTHVGSIQIGEGQGGGSHFQTKSIAKLYCSTLFNN